METPPNTNATPPLPSPAPQLYGFCADKKAPSAKEFRKWTPTRVSAAQLNRDAGWGRGGGVQKESRHLGSFPFSFIQLERPRLVRC